MAENFVTKLAELKKELGIETKTRSSGNSKFALVKKVLMEENSCKEEALYKIFTELRTRGLDVKLEQKRIKALVSDLLTRVRKSYPGYESFELIDTKDLFQIVPATSTEEEEATEVSEN